MELHFQQAIKSDAFSPVLKERRADVQDTVLVSFRVLGRPGHVEEDQPGIMGFVDDHLVEFNGGVHPPHIGLISVTDTSLNNSSTNYPLYLIIIITIKSVSIILNNIMNINITSLSSRHLLDNNKTLFVLKAAVLEGALRRLTGGC